MTVLANLAKVLNDTNVDEVLAEAMGKPTSEVKRIVRRIDPRPIPKDVVREAPRSSEVIPARAAEHPGAPRAIEQRARTEPLTETMSRVYMNVDCDYLDLLKALRAGLSHKMPGAADFEILKESMRRTLKDLEKRQGLVDKPRADRIGKSGRISSSVRRIVRKRDQGMCQWHSDDGGICGSTHRVQFHHRQDRGKGGEGTPENIILLCQKHNLLAAEISWGEERIDRFRKRPREQAPEELQSRLDFSVPH